MKDKYTKLKNNLLEIKGRDKTVFTKIDNVKYIDILTKFGESTYDSILNKSNFNINLKEKDYKELKSKIKNSNSSDFIIKQFEYFSVKLSNVKKINLSNENQFQNTKDLLINEIEEKIHKSLIRWKQFDRFIKDTYNRENIYTLYVATCFVSLKTTKSAIYGPMLLKEVKLKIDGNNVTIASDKDWSINEKIIFLLNNDGYELEDEFDSLLRDKTTNECIKIISERLNIKIADDNLKNKFINYQKHEIKNKYLESHPGLILGVFRPFGGNSRKVMMKIIEEDEIEEILDADFEKINYEKKVLNIAKDHSNKILRVQNSNFSQDKALISGLKQNTIIWGPPGTGKSQVIANIISNLLYYNKKAVVMSQKRAALDVLRSRLGELSIFVLFITDTKNTPKEEFYKNLKLFIDKIESNYCYTEHENNNENIISDKEKEYLKFITRIKDTDSYKTIIKLCRKFKKNMDVLEEIYTVNPNYIYPSSNVTKEEYLLLFTSVNSIKKNRYLLFFKKWSDHVVWLSDKAYWILQSELDIDLNQILKDISGIEIDDIKKMIYFQNTKRTYKYNNNKNYIINTLAYNINFRIKNWKIYLKEYYKEYRRFANAIRAGRQIPYKFFNKFSKIIKLLFNIIITTPETSFINWEKNYFDYAIIDEASQMFLEVGLPILYIAKHKILAGDIQQMKPSKWFAQRDDGELDDDDDVAENAESILDYALEKGIYKIMLNKNYRSYSASLMSFSSKHFYDSKLEVIDHATDSLAKPIEVINVNGVWESGINRKEIDELIALSKKYLKKRSEFSKIILLTFNVKQRNELEKAILEYHPVLFKAIEEDILQIRNIENIQGDEADLVIMSIVSTPETRISGTYVVRKTGMNALNVAISRAKKELIVVKSITSENIGYASSEDYKIFKEWLSFLDMKQKDRKIYSHNVSESYGKTESNFEEDVKNKILKYLKFSVKLDLIKQYEVGSKKIDLAFIDSKKRYILGIEVDGYKYHELRGINKYLEDCSRQEFLEMKGYNIFRIKEIDWKINYKEVLKNLQNSLDMLIEQNKYSK